MFFNEKIIYIFYFIFTTTLSSIKNNIIQNLKNINNIIFNFEQNINGK